MGNLVGKKIVFEKDGKFWVNSLDVGIEYQKDHKKILRSIREIFQLDSDFAKSNFGLCNYSTKLSSRNYPYYVISEEGFLVLQNTFTGKKARKVSIEIAKQFIKMRDVIIPDLAQRAEIAEKKVEYYESQQFDKKRKQAKKGKVYMNRANVETDMFGNIHIEQTTVEMDPDDMSDADRERYSIQQGISSLKGIANNLEKRINANKYDKKGLVLVEDKNDRRPWIEPQKSGYPKGSLGPGSE